MGKPQREPRSTKIVATIGPRAEREGELVRLLSAGVDVVRVNGAHCAPGDVARRFDLLFTGTVHGAPFSATVPVAVGIADRCVPEEATRDFDGVLGLLEPLARLVPSGDPVPYPATAFAAGDPLPLSLRLWCGNRELDDVTVDPP